MPLTFLRNDITRVHAEAIVNAANSGLRAGGGVCGSIFRAAGDKELQAACNVLGHCEHGQAVITPGFRLSKYIIHAVGPVWNGGKSGEAETLRSCYHAALALCLKYEIGSVAFPLISTGVYGYPHAEAMAIAVETIRAFLQEEDPDLEVTLVLFDRESHETGRRMYGSFDSRLEECADVLRRAQAEARGRGRGRGLRNDNFLNELLWYQLPLEEACSVMRPLPPSEETLKKKANDLRQEVRQEKTFTDTLLELIDRSGKKDSEIYNDANVTRQHFSKIRSNRYYNPSKDTVMAFCIALQLDSGEAQQLMESAGYTFVRSNLRDMFILYYITRHAGNVIHLNLLLLDSDLPQLGRG